MCKQRSIPVRLLLLACHRKLKVIRTIDGSDWLVDELRKTAVDQSFLLQPRRDDDESSSQEEEEEEEEEEKDQSQ